MIAHHTQIVAGLVLSTMLLTGCGTTRPAAMHAATPATPTVSPIDAAHLGAGDDLGHDLRAADATPQRLGAGDDLGAAVFARYATLARREATPAVEPWAVAVQFGDWTVTLIDDGDTPRVQVDAPGGDDAITSTPAI